MATPHTLLWTMFLKLLLWLQDAASFLTAWILWSNGSSLWCHNDIWWYLFWRMRMLEMPSNATLQRQLWCLAIMALILRSVVKSWRWSGDRQEVMDDHFFTESEKGNRWRTTEMVDGDEVFLIAQKGDTWTAAFVGMYSMYFFFSVSKDGRFGYGCWRMTD